MIKSAYKKDMTLNAQIGINHTAILHDRCINALNDWLEYFGIVVSNRKRIYIFINRIVMALFSHWQLFLLTFGSFVLIVFTTCSIFKGINDNDERLYRASLLYSGHTVLGNIMFVYACRLGSGISHNVSKTIP